MREDMRIVKFETLVNDIQDATKISCGLMGIFSVARVISRGVSETTGNSVCSNPALALVYDYDKLNSYGKTILNRSGLFLTERDDIYNDVWTSRYQNINQLKELKGKIDASKEFVRLCRNDRNRDEAYKFLFWAMMVLTVDKSDSEEHLSLICDFARMLKISDDEMLDILKVIKIVLHEENWGESFFANNDGMLERYLGGDLPGFKSDKVPSVFAQVLELCN